MGDLSTSSVVPDWAAAVAEMVPVAGPLVAPLVKQLAELSVIELRRNHSRVLALACERSGLSRADLAERIERRPELISLTTRVLYEAGMNGQDNIVEILAGFLGEALNDPDRAEDVHALLGPITSMSNHHITVLRELTVEAGGSERGTRRSEQFLHSFGFRYEIARAALLGLYAAGFAEAIGISGGDASGRGGGDIVAITDLGRSLLEVLDTVRDADAHR